MTALTRPIEQAFRSARIPYQVVGGVAFYERQEIKDVLAYLNLMINPKDDMAFARVVNVPPRGLGKTSIEHLTAAARLRGIPLLAMAREARSVAAIKDKAGRGLEDFARLDRRAGGFARPAGRGGRRAALDPDRLSRALEGRRSRQRRGSPGEPR